MSVYCGASQLIHRGFSQEPDVGQKPKTDSESARKKTKSKRKQKSLSTCVIVAKLLCKNFSTIDNKNIFTNSDV
jgi:hypothetical protein